MKKFISLFLVLAMTAAVFAGCGSEKPAKENLTDSLETIIGKIEEIQPADFGPVVMPIDVTDKSEEGLWMLKNNTGLDSADKIKEAAVYESMIGSLAFSLAMVRVNDAADAKAVGEEMKAGIDPRKWICVEADDLMVAGYGDVVMLVMVDTGLNLTAQAYVDAFQSVCGAELDFVI